MTISTPEELLKQITESINNKDLDSFVSLYEPEASLSTNQVKILTEQKN
ncbi:MAG: hypothetical protein P0116_08095 [Candidatus Nitrosocosmicus sp.]|nr:hypothetical protein [Candidatus Nitrosocosmicus sp.]